MSEKILVVDDEREIADLLEVYLKNENYTVFWSREIVTPVPNYLWRKRTSKGVA